MSWHATWNPVSKSSWNVSQKRGRGLIQVQFTHSKDPGKGGQGGPWSRSFFAHVLFGTEIQSRRGGPDTSGLLGWRGVPLGQAAGGCDAPPAGSLVAGKSKGGNRTNERSASV